MKLLLAFLATLTFLCSAAQAQQRPPATLSNRNGGTVIVWKDTAKMREGMQLIEAGVNRTRPQMVMALLSCIVENGAQIVVTNGGFATSTVLVVDGRDAGCRGDVDNVFINRPR